MINISGLLQILSNEKLLLFANSPSEVVLLWKKKRGEIAVRVASKIKTKTSYKNKHGYFRAQADFFREVASTNQYKFSITIFCIAEHPFNTM